MNGLAPHFVFGDFNFRCDTEGVVKVSEQRDRNLVIAEPFPLISQKLTDDLTIHRILNVKNDNYKVQYRDPEGKNVLTIGKKEFLHTSHQTKFKESWVGAREALSLPES